MVYKKSVFTVILLLLVNGCGVSGMKENFDSIVGKEEKPYNKSAQKWYDEIGRDLSHGELEKADKKYLSLRSEHMSSLLIPISMIVLAQAHMAEQEYLLANYYLDEYIKITNGSNSEYASFLKIKASFLGIKDINKDQKLVMDTLTKAKSFYALHKSSQYGPPL